MKAILQLKRRFWIFAFLSVAQVPKVTALKGRTFTSAEDFVIAALAIGFMALFLIGVALAINPQADNCDRPGFWRSLSVAKYLLPRKLREEVIDNSINDFRQEWIEARRNHPRNSLLYVVFYFKICWLIISTARVLLERILRQIPGVVVLFKIFGK